MNNLPIAVTNYQPIIDKFINDQDCNDCSKDTYRKGLKAFFTWCNDSQVQTITPRTILDYKQKMKTEQKSAYTINLYLQCVKKFFKWTEANGLHKNVAKSIKRVKVPKGFSKDALTREQAQKLVLSVENPRDRAMTLLMISTGLRCVEVVRANIEDMRNVGNDTILMVQGKGHTSKDDFVKVPSEVVEEIQAYIATRTVKAGDPLFASESRNNMGGRMATGTISWIVKTALRGIGIDDPRLTAHSLRHTCATFALLEKATLQEVKDLLRHATLAMVMIYAHNINKMKSRTSEQVVRHLLNNK